MKQYPALPLREHTDRNTHSAIKSKQSLHWQRKFLLLWQYCGEKQLQLNRTRRAAVDCYTPTCCDHKSMTFDFWPQNLISTFSKLRDCNIWQFLGAKFGRNLWLWNTLPIDIDIGSMTLLRFWRRWTQGSRGYDPWNLTENRKQNRSREISNFTKFSNDPGVTFHNI